MAVFVLDKSKRPLMPCTEKRARLLLERGRAVVARLHPFTIRLKDCLGGAVQPLRLKLDPGSRTTGLALVRGTETVDPDTGAASRTEHVLWLGELAHRGKRISDALSARRQMRRRRRTANLRHRPARFDNRGRRTGRLAPSLHHRVETTAARVARLRRLAPISALSQELVRFDMQAIEDPTIEGVGYQQGELAGYEFREYVLLRGAHRCAYCGAKGVPLQVDHVVPRASGGSNRVSNLVPACTPCNQAKGSRPVNVFLARRPKTLAKIKAQLKRPLKDAAAVNSTRNALLETLAATGLPVETASGGLTKHNRTGRPGCMSVASPCAPAAASTSAPPPAWCRASPTAAAACCRLLQRADGYGYSFHHKPQEAARRAA
jgi:5-methylcytosine-specific restriction endonuclease McrA